VYRSARWQRGAGGTMVGHVRSAEASDVWATPFVPEAVLPAAQLENIFRVSLSLQQPAAPVRRLRLGRLARFAAAGSGPVVRSADATWSVLDESAQTAFHLEGLAYEA
jgi:hypothetical protein